MVEKSKSNAPSDYFSPEDLKRINDVLLYQKFRDDGKNEHKNRDIHKKIKKANARKKAEREKRDIKPNNEPD
ncbi:MAG: hypothetical protein LBH16_11020 [Treponema sp.]|nr:hypothetical protein [Treponema sp.]